MTTSAFLFLLTMPSLLDLIYTTGGKFSFVKSDVYILIKIIKYKLITQLITHT
jgi:hypothetical protein